MRFLGFLLKLAGRLAIRAGIIGAVLVFLYGKGALLDFRAAHAAFGQSVLGGAEGYLSALKNTGNETVAMLAEYAAAYFHYLLGGGLLLSILGSVCKRIGD